MNGMQFRNDRGPWVALAGYPLRTPTVLVLACLVSMLLTTLAIAFNAARFGAWLWLDSEAVWTRGELWRLGTYVLWNRPDPLGFSMDLLMLWWFGRELEDFFGRRIFLRLCLGIVLVPALAGVLMGWFSPFQFAGVSGVFSLFVAYATLAPEVTLLFGVSAKWMAVLFLGLKGFAALASHAWGPLGMTLAGAGFAYAYVRHEQGLLEWPDWGAWWLSGRRPAAFEIVRDAEERFEEPKLSRVPSGLRGEVAKETEVLARIDPLLEKIGRSGMGSLTEEERQDLQLARETLLKRESAKNPV
jgi:membrane associated rhomboid family serine protease